MELHQIISNNIRKCLDDNSMSLYDFSEVIGCTKETCSRYVHGKTCIDADKLYLVAKYFNKTLDWFYEEVHNTQQITVKDYNTLLQQKQSLLNLLVKMDEAIQIQINKNR